MTVTEAEIKALAKSLLADLALNAPTDSAVVLALTGNLGAGKTTLVQALAKELNVSSAVTSPTFVICKSYPTEHPVFTKLVHLDAYRLEAESELGPLHFSEILAEPHTLVCIEWPEKIASALPPHLTKLSLTVIDETSRQVTYEKT